MLDCSDKTTLDDFGSGILVKEESDDYFGGVALGKEGVGFLFRISFENVLTPGSPSAHRAQRDIPKGERQSLPNLSAP